MTVQHHGVLEVEPPLGEGTSGLAVVRAAHLSGSLVIDGGSLVQDRHSVPDEDKA